MHGDSDYGMWPLVVINSVIFIFFAFSFTKPKTTLDWRSFGAFSALASVSAPNDEKNIRAPRTNATGS